VVEIKRLVPSQGVGSVWIADLCRSGPFVNVDNKY
jgi:hypothetical protein